MLAVAITSSRRLSLEMFRLATMNNTLPRLPQRPFRALKRVFRIPYELLGFSVKARVSERRVLLVERLFELFELAFAFVHQVPGAGGVAR